MDRASAVVYLNGRFETIIAALSMRPTDDARGLGGSIDGALRDLGLVPSATVVTADEPKYAVLLRVNFLRHALERAATLVDIASNEPLVQAKRSQVFSQIETTLKHAESEYVSILAIENDPSNMELFRLNLDYVQDLPAE